MLGCFLFWGGERLVTVVPVLAFVFGLFTSPTWLVGGAWVSLVRAVTGFIIFEFGFRV